MGHHLAEIELDAVEAEAQVRTMGWMPLTTGLVMVAARKWRDEEAGRWDDERTGDGHLAPLMSAEAAERWLGKNMELAHSRSVVIPLCSSDDTVVRRTKVTLTVSGDELRDLRKYPGALNNRIAGEVGVGFVSAHPVKLPVIRAPRAHATEGKARTVYDLCTAHSIVATTDSQAEARAAGIAYMKNHFGVTRLTVRARTVRDTGDADLVVIERPEPTTAKVTFAVEVHTPKGDAKAEKYLVAFDYHS